MPARMGFSGRGDTVLLGRGWIVDRAHRPEERAVLAEHVAAPGETTFDVHLNGEAFWSNIPAASWGLPAWCPPSAQETAILSGAHGLGREMSGRGGSALLRHRAVNSCVLAGVVRRTRVEATMTEKLIDRNPDVLGGTPVFSGTRVPVRILMEHLEAGDRLDDFLDDYPTVTREQAVGLLERATAQLVEGGLK